MGQNSSQEDHLDSLPPSSFGIPNRHQQNQNQNNNLNNNNNSTNNGTNSSFSTTSASSSHPSSTSSSTSSSSSHSHSNGNGNNHSNPPAGANIYMRSYDDDGPTSMDGNYPTHNNYVNNNGNGNGNIKDPRSRSPQISAPSSSSSPRHQQQQQQQPQGNNPNNQSLGPFTFHDNYIPNHANNPNSHHENTNSNPNQQYHHNPSSSPSSHQTQSSPSSSSSSSHPNDNLMSMDHNHNDENEDSNRSAPVHTLSDQVSQMLFDSNDAENQQNNNQNNINMSMQMNNPNDPNGNSDPNNPSSSSHYYGLLSQPRLETVPTAFKWVHGGVEVYVTGSFNNWQGKILMYKNEDGEFSLIIDIPPGTHHYKYIVDQEWMLDEDANTVEVNGVINNVVEVKRPVFEYSSGGYADSDDEGDVDDKKNKSSYGQRAPLSTDYVNEPVKIPPHLTDILLSQMNPTDSQMLPVPNHVVLNHLYVLQSADNSLFVSGITQRFKPNTHTKITHKFVTTVYYCPKPTEETIQLFLEGNINNNNTNNTMGNNPKQGGLGLPFAPSVSQFGMIPSASSSHLDNSESSENLQNNNPNYNNNQNNNNHNGSNNDVEMTS